MSNTPLHALMNVVIEDAFIEAVKFIKKHFKQHDVMPKKKEINQAITKYHKNFTQDKLKDLVSLNDE